MDSLEGKAEVRQSPFSKITGEILDEIARLDKAVSDIQKKVEPLCHQRPEACGEASKPAEEPSCQAVGELRVIKKAIQEQRLRIETLLNRLEI